MREEDLPDVLKRVFLTRRREQCDSEQKKYDKKKSDIEQEIIDI